MSFYHSSTRDPLITLIIDEELHSRQRLSRLLREIAPEFTGIAEASNVAEAHKKIERFSPNLIFSAFPLCSQLQSLNGVTKDIPKVVVCKEPQNAESMIMEMGGYYLVKPVDAQHLRDLLDALYKPKKKVEGNGAPKFTPPSSVIGKRSYLNRLVVKHQGRFRLLPVERVIWFGTEFRLVYAYTEIRRYPIDLGLDQLEKRLDPGGFARIHRSAIVNVSRIRDIVPISGGRSKVLLKEPQKRSLPLSASRAKPIKEFLSTKNPKFQA